MTSTPPAETPPARDDVLATLDETMAIVRDNIDTRDPQSPADERLLGTWLRMEGYLAGQYRLLTADTDLHEMEETLTRLKPTQEAREEES